MTTSELMNEIKANPSVIDTLLYPGKQLSDFNEDNLKIDILPSGFTSLDEKMLFKRGRGELIIIGARPSIGKSGFGFQLAANIASRGKSHIFSLEMDHESVAARQMAVIMNKPLDYLQKGLATSEEITEARAQLNKLNCVIDDRVSLNINQICDAARMQNKKHRTDLIVVDYIQIVEDTENEFSRAISLGKISLGLKNLAKELRIPVIALSQLNRNSEFRDDGTPQLSDLKESGSLEQDADVVLLLHRPKDTPNTANVIIAKNRNGSCGEIQMDFAPAQVKFIDRSNNELE